jgi:hypothetical protein
MQVALRVDQLHSRVGLLLDALQDHPARAQEGAREVEGAVCSFERPEADGRVKGRQREVDPEGQVGLLFGRVLGLCGRAGRRGCTLRGQTLWEESREGVSVLL